MRSVPILLLLTLGVAAAPLGAGEPAVAAGTLACTGTVHITFSPPLGLTDHVGTFEISPYQMPCYAAVAFACEHPLPPCQHDPCPGDPQQPCIIIGCPDPTPLDVCEHFSGVPGQGTSAAYYGNCARAFLHDAIGIPAGKNDVVDAVLVGGVAIHATQVAVAPEAISGIFGLLTFDGALTPDAGSTPCNLSSGTCDCAATVLGVGQFG